jgi:asparaginyl-tRNA synthetase
MARVKIKEVLKGELIDQTINVKGWVRTFRNNSFIAINDGSSINNIQAVVNFETTDETILKRIGVTGKLVASQGKGQSVEIIVNDIVIYGDSEADVTKPNSYPLQPKAHSLEYLREIAHLRFRTNTFGAIFRVRHTLAYAIHSFFNQKGFVYLHTPIITASDAEGAGEMFHVTNFDIKNPPLTEAGDVDYKQDFFGKATNLTVSGQLEGELGAMAFSDVYTFGPTFRAENSNTARHLAEFWMIEPEMAFYDLADNMVLAEEMLKFVINYALEKNKEDIEFLSQRLLDEEKQKPQTERSELNLLEKLNFCLSNEFAKITYTEAIDILRESNHNKKKKFQYIIDGWGADLQSEHERYLVEKHFKKPVILTDYPKDIKSFYMRQNDDGKTVAAMDILFPGIGEIIGGSQREERLEKLETRMNDMHIPTEEMSWYLDTRRFGACPHAGFGLGVTGMTNIRDVIPFPRTPNNCEF